MHADNKEKDILILGKDGLDDTEMAAEYSIKQVF